MSKAPNNHLVSALECIISAIKNKGRESTPLCDLVTAEAHVAKLKEAKFGMLYAKPPKKQKGAGFVAGGGAVREFDEPPLRNLPLREYRKALGMNQRDFWELFGVTGSCGSRYEAGRDLPAATEALISLVRNGVITPTQLSSHMPPMRTYGG